MVCGTPGIGVGGVGYLMESGSGECFSLLIDDGLNDGVEEASGNAIGGGRSYGLRMEAGKLARILPCTTSWKARRCILRVSTSPNRPSQLAATAIIAARLWVYGDPVIRAWLIVSNTSCLNNRSGTFSATLLADVLSMADDMRMIPSKNGDGCSA